jgi:Flp pilus assembly pilin Flp
MLPPTVQLVIMTVVMLVGVPLVVTAILREFAKVGTNND